MDHHIPTKDRSDQDMGIEVVGCWDVIAGMLGWLRWDSNKYGNPIALLSPCIIKEIARNTCNINYILPELEQGGGINKGVELLDEAKIIQLVSGGQKEAEDLLKTKVDIDGCNICLWDVLPPSSHPVESMALLVGSSAAGATAEATRGKIRRQTSTLAAKYDHDLSYDIGGQFFDDNEAAAAAELEEISGSSRDDADVENEDDVEIDPRLGQVLHSLNAVRNFEEPLQHIRLIRDEVALLNSQYVPQLVDRSRGRFYKREKRGLVDDGDDGDLSDDDCMAVPFDYGGKQVVEYGLIERMVGTSSNGGRHSRTQISRASINDDNVTLIARFFEEVKGAAKSQLPDDVVARAGNRRIFKLLQDAKDGIRRVSMEAVLALVHMDHDEDGKVYFLDKEDENAAQEVFEELFCRGRRTHEEADLGEGPSAEGSSKKARK